MDVRVPLLFLVLTRATLVGSSRRWGKDDGFLDIPGYDDFFRRTSRKITPVRDFVQMASPHLPSPTADVSSCSQRSCAGQQNVQLWQKVNDNYSGLFFSPSDIDNMNTIQRRTFQEADNQPALPVLPGGEGFDTGGSETVPGSDFDQCCETQRLFRRVSGFLSDVNNTQCNVISLAGKFQVANVGTCISGRVGGCTGTCRQEMTLIHLLCVNQSGQLQFRMFQVEGYCSCKAN